MANLKVTFGRKSDLAELEHLEGARTELILITAGVELSTLVVAQEEVVTLYPEADCWVSGAKHPNPVTGANRRFLKAEVQRQFTIRAGMKIGVVAA